MTDPENRTMRILRDIQRRVDELSPKLDAMYEDIKAMREEITGLGGLGDSIDALRNEIREESARFRQFHASRRRSPISLSNDDAPWREH